MTTAATKQSCLEALNDAQREAASNRGNTLVLAGPGSGKTRTMTHRGAHLINTQTYEPQVILGLTFTNKAADEMNERLANLLGYEYDPENTETLAGDKIPLLSTFHSFGYKILQHETPLFGRGSDFVIFDQGDAKQTIKQAITDLREEGKIRVDENNPKWLINSARACIDNAKNAGQPPEDYVLTADRAEEVQYVVERYETLLEQANAFDLGDLLEKTLRVLRPADAVDSTPSVQYDWRGAYDHIMVDEFQDTNQAQYDLVNHLADNDSTVFAVGDDDQAIYTWRGADVSKILEEFEQDYADPTVVRLEKNYRSTPSIVETASNLIGQNTKRRNKVIRSMKTTGQTPSVHSLWNNQQEASFIADRIMGFIETGQYLFGDFAVLVRTNAQTRDFEETFVNYEIPYTIIGAQRFFERKEVKDIAAYLALIENPDHIAAFDRIINTPTRGIGPSTKETIYDHRAADNGIDSVKEAVYDLADNDKAGGRAQSAIDGAARLFRRLDDNTRPSDAIEDILDATGYIEDCLKKKYDDENEADSSFEQRKENVEEMINMASQFETQHSDTSITNYLNEVALYSDVDEADPDTDDSVSVMTMHAAKGLEFPVVFVAGLEDGIVPHGNSLDETAPLVEQEEERRLCYVAMTRAEDRLIGTCARFRYRYGERKSMDPSPFIDEAGLDMINHD